MISSTSAQQLDAELMCRQNVLVDPSVIQPPHSKGHSWAVLNYFHSTKSSWLDLFVSQVIGPVLRVTLIV